MDLVEEEDPNEQFSETIESLRQRKKRELHQLISDTATQMFLEMGFDEVKVADVAVVCGVSEKTIYNYFPTKESLILDREEMATEAIRAALGPDGTHQSPVQAALSVLEADRAMSLEFWKKSGKPEIGMRGTERFLRMVSETPQLQVARSEMAARLTQVIAETLAERANVNPEDPEPQIAARSLMGLWEIQYNAMLTGLERHSTPDELMEHVENELNRAARLIESGLWSFEAVLTGDTAKSNLQSASEIAWKAGQRVIQELKRAHKEWESEPGSRHAHRGRLRDNQNNARAQRGELKAFLKQQHEERKAMIEKYKKEMIAEKKREAMERNKRRKE